MRYLSIRNYEKHQHYKDRRPPWIKLHVEVLDDYEFMQLSDASKAHLMLLWVLASKMDNKIPHDLSFIAQRIGSTTAIDLEDLFVRGFLETHTEEGARGKREEWPSRHVSAQTRTALLSAAQHKCAACGAAENLEIDHIVPISKGGTGELTNLQVLCRQCNRRKRAKLQHEAAQPQRSNVLRSAQHSALLETETEAEREAEQAGAVAPIRPAVVRAVRPPRVAPSAWTVEGVAWWEPTVGAMTTARFQKALSTIVRIHGWEAVYDDLRAWVGERKPDGKACKLEWYAEVASARIGSGAVAMFDPVTRELTAYGERMTRPAKVPA